ncbi:MAG: GNAT family N-acetyltransferase, partial [Candidatus Omnitrophica bacterium]|nr:GNAT family N-acetyltransferase [Candidatus Omnitrophota bacterium]
MKTIATILTIAMMITALPNDAAVPRPESALRPIAHRLVDIGPKAASSGEDLELEEAAVRQEDVAMAKEIFNNALQERGLNITTILEEGAESVVRSVVDDTNDNVQVVSSPTLDILYFSDKVFSTHYFMITSPGFRRVWGYGVMWRDKGERMYFQYQIFPEFEGKGIGSTALEVIKKSVKLMSDNTPGTTIRQLIFPPIENIRNPIIRERSIDSGLPQFLTKRGFRKEPATVDITKCSFVHDLYGEGHKTASTGEDFELEVGTINPGAVSRWKEAFDAALDQRDLCLVVSSDKGGDPKVRSIVNNTLDKIKAFFAPKHWIAYYEDSEMGTLYFQIGDRATNKIVGYGTMWYEKNRIYFQYQIFPEFRRRGIGSTALEMIKKSVKILSGRIPGNPVKQLAFPPIANMRREILRTRAIASGLPQFLMKRDFRREPETGSIRECTFVHDFYTQKA